MPAGTGLITMASSGRLIATPASATIDTTIALANLNFDFSLCKVEPQPEFRGIGSSLSPVRRHEAENGPTHVTARKLGALFEPLLPSTTALAKAYGLRATEIIQKSKIEKEVQPSLGVFASQVGVDGTSIWAAATSGHGTIRVHLLACMLARIWEAAEATSIWVEIVQERKRDIASTFDSGNTANIATYMTAQQELTREQLANWDASARAWLRAADDVEARRQKQLELILSNVNVSGNSKPSVWESVLQAWKSAMQAVDCLICGMPQQAQTGEIFLGLSAWHLYPDILVLGASTIPVKLNDPLVHPAGLLTLGLQSERTGQDHGVHWSLPLAHLRYYGDPIVRTRSVTKNGSRLTLAEFLQTTLGAVFESWGHQGRNSEDCAKFLKALKTAVLFDSSRPTQMLEDSWLDILGTAASDFLASESHARIRYTQLHVLGRKYSQNLVGKTMFPCFAFASTQTWFGLHTGQEASVKALRVIASQLPIEAENLFIRYSVDDWACCSSKFEYASAKISTADDSQMQQHCRWIHTGSDLSHLNKSRATIEKMQNRTKELTKSYKHMGELVQPLEEQVLDEEHVLDEENQGLRIHWRQRHRDSGEIEQRVFQSMSKKQRQKLQKKRQFFSNKHFYKLLFGDPQEAALYIVYDSEYKSVPVRERYKEEAAALRKAAEDRMKVSIGFSDITEVLIRTAGSSNSKAELQKGLNWVEFDYKHSLKVIATLARVFKALPHATIDVRILQQPLHEQIWVPKTAKWPEYRIPNSWHQTLSPYPLNRQQCFSCIINLESSQYRIEPEKLTAVLAVSTGDSIFVASPLLCDPIDAGTNNPVQRIMGNVGRAGVALLVPPQSPKVKKLGIDTWDLINQTTFDGNFEDCFANTSLHLSFTGANMPLDMGFTGNCDREVYILETVVSVHEAGQWVADLDVLGSLASRRLERDFSRQPSCSNEHWEARHTDLLGPPIRSLENWSEFLDRPDSGSVFRALGNWQARLAATVLGLAQGHRVFVVQRDVCWKCVKDRIEKGFKGKVGSAVMWDAGDARPNQVEAVTIIA
jgi:hypothetical protein